MSAWVSPRAVGAIARVTIGEIVHDRFFYGAGIFALLVIALGAVASRLSLGQDERILIDLMLAGVTAFGVLAGVVLGAGLLPREFERRTALVVLSRPISRMDLILGKYVGLAFCLGANQVILLLIGLAALLAYGGDPSLSLAVGASLALAQAFLAAGVALFFSSFATTTVSVSASIGVYLIGTNLSQLRSLADKLEDANARRVIRALALVLPDFESLGSGLAVTHGIPVPWPHLVAAIAQALAFASALLLLSFLLLRGREA